MISEFQGQYRWLSNFYPCTVMYEGETYSSVEHAFQAAKTVSSGQRQQIRTARTPGQAKRLGRRVTLRNDWDIIKLPVMKELLLRKFTLDAELKNKLIATDEHELIEGNNWNDRFWGVCRGEGQNHLGKLLMEVRNDIQ